MISFYRHNKKEKFRRYFLGKFSPGGGVRGKLPQGSVLGGWRRLGGEGGETVAITNRFME